MSFSCDQTLATNPNGPECRRPFACETAILIHHPCRPGIETSLIGAGRPWQRLESAITKVAQADLPVLIQAEFGSGELAVAGAIHDRSSRRERPFVVLHCAPQQPSTFRSELAAALEKARGGSLFLQSIDELDCAMQKELLSFPGLFACADPALDRVDARILASATLPLVQLVEAGRFLRFLRTELEVLKIEVPPLRARPEDLKLLLEHELKKHERCGLKKLSQEALAACQAYSWPENLLELRRVAAQLAVMSDGDCIGLDDLRTHLGWLPTSLGSGASGEGTSTGEAGAESETTPSGHNADPADPSSDPSADPSADPLISLDQRIVDLGSELVDGRFEHLGRYGPGLERALTYIARNFDHEISLTELARQSYFSSSHLSFLFKKTLGISFKGILAVVRIEKARRLLLEKPHDSITELSLDVGFGDLSHFEKTFKRITGLSPREYRRRKLNEMDGLASGIR